MTIYGHSGKPRHMLSVTLTIQQPYMADLGYYRKLCHTRTCKVLCWFFTVYTRKMTFLIVHTRKMSIQQKLLLVWARSGSPQLIQSMLPVYQHSTVYVNFKSPLRNSCY